MRRRPPAALLLAVMALAIGIILLVVVGDLRPGWTDRVNQPAVGTISQNDTDVVGDQEDAKPPAVGTTMLISRETIIATIRNPDPVTNVYGMTYASGETCFLTKNVRLEALGGVEDSTLARVKDFNEAMDEEARPSMCPVGSVFFLPNGQAQEFAVYASELTQRRHEEQLQEQRERENVDRLLREYERKNR